MNENWRPVVGYEGLYEVSDLGRVRSLDSFASDGRRVKGQMMRAKRRAGGYLDIGLRNGAQRMFRIQRLVLEAFVGPCPDGMVACHCEDRNRQNCRLDNLRWDTQKANVADSIRQGTRANQWGERGPRAKLTATDIERIFDLRRAGCLHREISAWIGAKRRNITDILAGKSWAHLGMAS